MTEKEFAKYMLRSENSKDPKTMKVQMESEKPGVNDSYYIFKDPESPFSKLRVVQSMGEERRSTLMEEENHCHRHQGMETWAARKQKRLTESSLLQLLRPRAMSEMSTAAEHYTKLHGEPPADVRVPEVLHASWGGGGWVLLGQGFWKRKKKDPKTLIHAALAVVVGLAFGLQSWAMKISGSGKSAFHLPSRSLVTQASSSSHTGCII